MGYFILDKDNNPVSVTFEEYVKWAYTKDGKEKFDRRVAHTNIGEVLVSTVFLGIDHSFMGGPPVLWETMIFGGPHNDYQERYTSRAAAEVGHMEAVNLVKNVDEAEEENSDAQS